MYFEQLFWKDAVIGDVGSNRYWRWIWEAVPSILQTELEAELQVIQWWGVSDCTGWKLEVHSHMSVQWITEQRSIPSAARHSTRVDPVKLQHPACDVYRTMSFVWGFEFNILCLKILDIFSNTNIKPNTLGLLQDCYINLVGKTIS